MDCGELPYNVLMWLGVGGVEKKKESVGTGPGDLCTCSRGRSDAVNAGGRPGGESTLRLSQGDQSFEGVKAR